jgi:hypothetical protein
VGDVCTGILIFPIFSYFFPSAGPEKKQELSNLKRLW